MTTKGWTELHQDVDVKLSTDHRALSFDILMIDKNHAGRTAERRMPFQLLPLEQGELVLEDYLCSVLEQLYQQIKIKRGK